MRKSGKSQLNGFPRRHNDSWRQEQRVRYPQPAVNPRRHLPRRGGR